MKTPTEASQATPTLADQRVLVVGASASVGPALVSALLAHGANVVATSRTGVGLPEAVAVTPEALDLAHLPSLDAFIDKVALQGWRFDVVVMLAGILPGKALHDYTDQMMQDVMQSNFMGQASLIRRLLPMLNDEAQVVMMSSISGERGSFDPIYAASKAAQIAFVKSMASWLAPKVRFNAIAPALIEGSTMFDAMAPERRAYHREQSPTKRLTTAAELAGVIVDLCGPSWKNLNGQVIRINGGVHV